MYINNKASYLVGYERYEMNKIGLLRLVKHIYPLLIYKKKIWYLKQSWKVI